jgi:hypothetical protein
MFGNPSIANTPQRSPSRQLLLDLIPQLVIDYHCELANIHTCVVRGRNLSSEWLRARIVFVRLGTNRRGEHGLGFSQRFADGTL